MEIKTSQKICFFTQMSLSTCAGSTVNALSVAQQIKGCNNHLRLLCYGKSYNFQSKDGLKTWELMLRPNGFRRYVIHLLNGLIIFSYLVRGYTFILYGVPHCRSLVLLYSRLIGRPVVLRSTMLGDDDLDSIKLNLPRRWIGNRVVNKVWCGRRQRVR